MIEPQASKGQILLLEAEQDLTSPLNALLAERGFSVRVVATEEQALQNLRDISVDLILLGSNLSKAQALGLCRRLEAIGTPAAPPVVTLSYDAEPDTVSELLAAGATDVLVSPVEEALLLARLEVHLELGALRNELSLRDALLDEEIASRRQVEESVRVAELSGRELVENLSEVIYTADPDGTLTYVSPGIERLLGYSPQEAVGRRVREFVHPESHRLLGERLPRVLAGHREANEYRLLAKTGETRWAHTSSQPVYAGEH